MNNKNIKKGSMKNIIFAIIAVALNLELTAQQTPISNFYNLNAYLLNPAEAGMEYNFAATLGHRKQWQGIEGAPKSNFLGIHKSLNDKMGIGGKITLDQTDILKQFNASLSYAYRVEINDKTNLSFGVSGMMIQNSVGYSDAIIGDYADEVINGGTESGMTFDAEAGIMLQYEKGKIGIASSHLLESGVDYNLSENRGTGTFERIRQFSAYGSYLFEMSENWDLEPSVLIRNQGVGSFQFEVNAMTSWKETLFIGAGYRQEAGYVGRIGFQISDAIIAAYAYEFSNSGIASYSSGSHEFCLGYRLKKNNGKKNQSIEKRLANSLAEPKKEELTKKETIEEVQVEEPKLKEEPKVEVQPEVVPEETAPTVTIEKELEAAFQKDIKFEFEASEKQSDELEKNAALDKIAAFLIANPNQKVIIEGHTCNMGSEEVNRKYSLKRANSVKDYLKFKGVNEDQMQVKAMLDSEPLVPNTSIANRQKNRRVEIELVD